MGEELFGRSASGLFRVVVKIRVRFGVPNIIRHLLFRIPKKGVLILTTTHQACDSAVERGVGIVANSMRLLIPVWLHLQGGPEIGDPNVVP